VITDGNLDVMAGDQVWSIGFEGLINQGLVELDATSGSLFDAGGMISNQVDANLGGVFTGNNAEAFVGGFDLLDELNEFNHVNGLFTIER